MRLLSFQSDDKLFAVDVASVSKFARKITLTPVPAAHSAVAGISNLKGKVITILNLDVLQNADGCNSEQLAAKTVNAVVFRQAADSTDQMALLIDKPGDLVEVEEEAVLPPPVADEEKNAFFVSGAAEIGGRLYTIIDADAIMTHFKGTNTEEKQKHGGADND